MRLGISNIAWDITEDDALAALLQRYKVDAIDIVPGKYFPKPGEAMEADILRVRQWWMDRGIEISGMQALLFNTQGLNVFGTPELQTALLNHLDAVCRIGEILGAPRMVFGSPKNRDRSGLSYDETMAIATSFFRRLGDIAASHGVMICLEPNPTCYGANFMTTSFETEQVVRQIAHTAIRMQFDTGALTINGEDPATVLQMSAGLIGHVHASEPNLLPLGDGNTDHSAMCQALSQNLPHHLVTIEMLTTQQESHLESIERALGVAIAHYRSKAKGLSS
ncbi:sugar phosphate isomerase/epimerase family protein [Undibacterium oligocarboniphilum]|uniref:Sugar phosphate isomerase/epimerase n=1 Tax=Undibacterium oligocarboniphilum TaxID=666702 RepID=A0A850QJZ3_9BURK|nr:TIM barrel protein [Undibacterium oligocarboniphilum]MBC3869476.1 sugar phosphate isomerase/epimerase [Undibacterium oligocarboniphilum]NVO77855.1 sugar phosphate isomerase/epimerase [Undibacterium oligocarboniphilum]